MGYVAIENPNGTYVVLGEEGEVKRAEQHPLSPSYRTTEKDKLDEQLNW